jgi:hypothetical protein
MTGKSYERIKDFSTSISVEKTISEIEHMLSKYGATKIMKEYDADGKPYQLIFGIMTEHGELSVKLPVRTEKILEVFQMQVSNKKLPRKYWSGDWAKEQANRVGWRIIKDWLDAQLTLIGIQMVKIHEIFLPYAYDYHSGKTLFETMEQKGFAGLIEDHSTDTKENYENPKIERQKEMV